MKQFHKQENNRRGKHRILAAVLGILFSAVAFLSVTGQTGITALAVVTPRAVNIGPDFLNNGKNTANAVKVHFGSADGTNDYGWYVVGYDGSTGGVRLNDGGSGKITLLSDRILQGTKFSDNTPYYKDSTLRTVIDNLASRIFDSRETAVIAKRDLTAGLSGGSVNNAVLWALASGEAGSVKRELRALANDSESQNWWLRTQSEEGGNYICVVTGDGGDDEVEITQEYNDLGARPAMNLDMSSVVLVTPSAFNVGKQSGTAGADGLLAVGNYGENAWKLTVKDDAHKNFAIQTATENNGTYTISYSGAATGTDEDISAIISDASGNVTYYGRLALSITQSSGTVTVNTTGKLRDGDKLYVFNEHRNASGRTDYSSELKELVFHTVTFEAGDGQGSVFALQKVYAGSTATCPDSAPARDGYTFANWIDSSSAVYDFGTAVNQDLTLTPTWAPVSYSITYYGVAGADVEGNPASYNIESNAVTFNEPTLKGWTFAGWTENEGDTPDKNLTIPTGSTGDKEITAHWTAEPTTARTCPTDISALGAGLNTANTAKIYYGTKADQTPLEWFVVGFDNKSGGITLREGTKDKLTLVSVGCLKNNIQFNSVLGANHYLGSQLFQEVLNHYSIFSDKERSFVIGRELAKYNHEARPDGVAGPAVQPGDALLWPLSQNEADSLHMGTIRGGNGEYFVRSPSDAAPDTRVFRYDNLGWGNNYDTTSKYGLRPAFNLELAPILFVSPAENGKPSGTGADALTAVNEENTGEWKLTMEDAGHAGFTLNSFSETEGVYTVNYSGAAVGQNEYISAIVTNGSGKILYYGRFAQASSASGSITINAAGKMAEGCRLFVFNEQCNGDKKTDYASALNEIVFYTVTFKTGDAEGSDFTTQRVYAGGTATVPDSVPTCDGYTFATWVDSTSAVYDFDTPVIGDLTLTPTWIPTENNITYYGVAGADVEGNPATYNIENDDVTFNEPTLKGWTFTGWTANEGDTPDKNLTIPAGSFGDKEITAHWTAEPTTARTCPTDISALSNGLNKANTAKIYYGSKADQTPLEWFVVGFDNKSGGIMLREGTKDKLTLVSVGTLKNNVKFNSVAGANEYLGSLLYHDTLEQYSIFTDKERCFVIGRELAKTTSAETEWVDGVAGPAVQPGDALIWPLSQKEADHLHKETIRGANGSFIARSPSGSNIFRYDNSGAGRAASTTEDSGGLRVGFNLELAPVLFVSAADNGKQSGTGEDALTAVSEENNREWKLTMADSDHAGFAVNDFSEENDVFTASYSGAVVGQNEYISAIITDGSGKILYYGRIKQSSSTSGSITINTAGKMPEGGRLFVFNEQCNGDKKTDYASALNVLKPMYSVSFNTAGADSTAPVSQTVIEGDTATCPAMDPIRAHYTFAGWLLNGELYDFDTPVYDDIELTASWTPVVYTIGYNGVEGEDVTFSEENPLSFTIEDEEIVLINPQKIGYDFAGWTGSCGDVPLTEVKIPTGSYGNKTYTANWRAALSIDEISDQQYTGSAIKPVPVVRFGEFILSAGKDYAVSYKNNTNAAASNEVNAKNGASIAPTVTVKGKGNYAGTATKTFSINKFDIDTANAPDMTFAYDSKKAQFGKTKVSFVANGKTVILKENKDFRYEFQTGGDYKEPGTYRTKIIGIGNFRGEKEYIQTIAKPTQILISKVTVPKIPDQTYTGKSFILKTKADQPLLDAENEIFAQTGKGDAAQDYLFTIKSGGETLEEGSDYSLSYTANKEIGTATVTITAKEGENAKYAGSATLTFKITGDLLSKLKMEKVENFMWSGAEQKQPDQMLYYTTGSGKDTVKNYLTEGEDYTVSYTNNVNVGTATVVYTGVNGYTGTIKKTFKITPYNIADVADSRITVTMSDAAPYTKGGAKLRPDQVEYVLKNGDDVVYRKELKEGVDYTLKWANNTAVTTDETKKNPSVMITGKGTFTGSRTSEFSITGTVLSDETVTVETKDVLYALKPGICKTTLIVIDQKTGAKLAAGTDYEKDVVYTYASATRVKDSAKPIKTGNKITDYEEEAEDRAAGSLVKPNDIIPAGTKINVTVTGKGAYRGVEENPGTAGGSFFIIDKSKDLSKAAITIRPQTYTGNKIKLTSADITFVINKTEVPLVLGEDYEIIEDSKLNYTDKGSYKVTIKGKGEQGYGFSKTVSFSITARSLDYSITYDANIDGLYAALAESMQANEEYCRENYRVNGTMKPTVTPYEGKLAKCAYTVQVKSEKNGKVTWTNVPLTQIKFKGWCRNADGRGQIFANAGMFNPSWLTRLLYGEKITLYAQWEVL